MFDGQKVYKVALTREQCTLKGQKSRNFHGEQNKSPSWVPPMWALHRSLRLWCSSWQEDVSWTHPTFKLSHLRSWQEGFQCSNVMFKPSHLCGGLSSYAALAGGWGLFHNDDNANHNKQAQTTQGRSEKTHKNLTSCKNLMDKERNRIRFRKHLPWINWLVSCCCTLLFRSEMRTWYTSSA